MPPTVGVLHLRYATPAVPSGCGESYLLLVGLQHCWTFACPESELQFFSNGFYTVCPWFPVSRLLSGGFGGLAHKQLFGFIDSSKFPVFGFTAE